MTKNSRLIIIYILTVLVSGTILTWLSLNNIANFKELTGNRISTEEKEIINKYSYEFQQTLERIASSLEAKLISESINFSQINNLEEGGIKLHFFLMNRHGVFNVPRYVNKEFITETLESSKKFQNKIKLAEQYEFASNNNKLALSTFNECLKWASNKSDSACVYNAIARIYAKLGDKEETIVYADKIITHYGLTSNEHGFPYAYFAVLQLLPLVSEISEAEDIVRTFLFELVNDNVVYNNYTETLISEIQSRKTDQSDSELSLLSNQVIQRIEMADNFKNQLQVFYSAGDSIQFKKLKGFYTANALNKKTDIILMIPVTEGIAGFALELEDIHKLLIQKFKITNRKFKYKLEFANPDSLRYTLGNHPYEEYGMFSTYFENTLLHLKPENSQEVDNYIFKRKLATILGLILLLGAMLMGLYILIRDFSRERNMEKMRTDFVSNVTHELKTPLTAINMLADSLSMGTVKKEEKKLKYAQTIVKESEKLRLMINNILEFSRKENNKLEYHIIEYDISRLVHEIMEEMRYWLEINNFNVVKDIQENVTALANPAGVKQVLLNLISNAIKYSPNEKKLLIKLYQNGNYTIIDVEDSGRGIPSDKQKIIFDKFYRIRSEVNDTISGTGLGLTVSQDIVKSMGGKLLVQSSPGIGSKFTVVLNHKPS